MFAKTLISRAEFCSIEGVEKPQPTVEEEKSRRTKVIQMLIRSNSTPGPYSVLWLPWVWSFDLASRRTLDKSEGDQRDG